MWSRCVYGSNPYHSRSTTSLMFESATLTPSWLLYSLEWIRWLYYAYIAHSRLRVEQSTQTLSSIIRIFIMITVHAREMDGEASLCSCKLYFPACTWGLRRHHRKAYWDFLTLKKCIINIRGWGGCTQATLKVICDLKHDQDICWMWSLVFIWWNWICLLNITVSYTHLTLPTNREV